MRITKEIKQEITKQMARSVFQSRFDSVIKRLIDRMDIVAKNHFSADHERAISLGHENEDLLLSINSRFYLESSTIKVTGFDLLNKTGFHIDRYNRLMSSQLSFFISKNNTHRYEIPATKDDYKVVEKNVDSLHRLKDEYNGFISDVTGVLASINTKNQLIQCLPEAEKYIPEEPKRLPIPIEKAKSIRAILKKAA